MKQEKYKTTGGSMIRITKMKFLTLGGLLALLCVLVCPIGRADDLTITLDPPYAGGNITVSPGDVVTIFGDITNNTQSTLYFVDDSLTFNDPTGTSLGGTPDVFMNALFGFGPASVDPGSPLTGVDLFTLIINPAAVPGVYSPNYYKLLASSDPSCAVDACASSSGLVGFTVTVKSPVTTPEPGSLVLLVSGLLLSGLLLMRRVGR